MSNYFGKQIDIIKNLNSDNSNKITLINIDSRNRNIYDKIESKTLQTHQDFLIIKNNRIYLKISPLQQLKKISNPTFIISYRKTGGDKDSQYSYFFDRFIIYHADKINNNILNTTFSNIDKQTDTIYYHITNDICLKSINNKDLSCGGPDSSISLILSLVTKHIIGYPNPNNYIIKLGYCFKNVTKINLVSGIFPVPSETPINGINPDYNSKLYLKNKNIKRSILLSPNDLDSDNKIVTSIKNKISQTLKNTNFISLFNK